jgi:hypothetical protein
VVRACHWSNIQYVHGSVNRKKWKSAPDRLDIMNLEWAGTEQSLDAARTLIKRSSLRNSL